MIADLIYIVMRHLCLWFEHLYGLLYGLLYKLPFLAPNTHNLTVLEEKEGCLRLLELQDGTGELLGLVLYLRNLARKSIQVKLQPQ